MKFGRVAVLAVLTVAFSTVAFGTELNDEISSFQVQLKPAPKKVSAVRPAVSNHQFVPVDPPRNAWNTPTTTRRAYVPASAQAQVTTVPVQRNTYYTAPATPTLAAQTEGEGMPQSFKDIFFRFTIMPALNYSTFDGSDQTNVIPSQFSSSGNTNFSGAILTDLHVGSSKFVLETGVMLINTNVPTGYAPTGGFGVVAQDQIQLGYIGVPIYAKYLFQGEQQSSFYVKAGFIPMGLTRHNYVASAGTYMIGDVPYNQFRFGGYNNFDVAGSGGIGYNFAITKHFQALIDLTAYQGFISVFNNVSVQNVGFMAGIGLSYIL